MSTRRMERIAIPSAFAAALLAALGCGGSGATGTGGGGTSTTTASGGGGATGTGGASTSSSAGGGGAAAQACANGPCVNVVNRCPFPLWIHASDHDGATLAPDDAKIEVGAVRQYDLPATWPSARVNAYWVDPQGAAPDPDAYDKVEVTYDGTKMNYNITYVDYLALPVAMEAVDAACPKTSKFDPYVACAAPVAGVLSGCPDGLLDGKRCISAGKHCSAAANASTPYCHALDAPLSTCETQNPATCGIAAQLGDTTANVYDCSGYFDSQAGHDEGNKWCAALNRGMLAQPDSTDASLYYQTPPYNTYAKWVHEICPGIYAFPYDDYPSAAGQSGYRSCPAQRLDVTFCPGG